ncbi:hypothetical protein [Kineococcus radiotolerans]|uniref:Uncharacterized protein n=1 Tax=Kineococcus radiotolerans (strain ATCC BAA-149 / DSM 14245 / SRS30216) TaxID=266940 RepID=A6W8S7_KINRD|nr:hypothetical protein [Kineococcus radiotolerans]ABS03216.1 hypothetical protein Krad_1730 [Kineococcus radiotolerans SRS30216 = ATCC BAA-149]
MKTPTERLHAALSSVLTDWDHALEPLPTPSAGKAPGPAGSKPPLPTSSLSVRAEVFEFLASWRRYLADRFADTPASWDVPPLARWFLHHADELATDQVILDELDRPVSGLVALAKELHDAANPPVPAGPALGDCPVCHETVRWVPLRAVACCGGCGVCRPWEEWKSILGVELATSSPVPSALVISFVGQEYHRTITKEQLWQWASRADGGPSGRSATGVHRHGKNAQGQTLYSLQEVKAWCDKLWKEGPRERAS